MRAPDSTFESYKSKSNFVFANLFFPRFVHFVIFNSSKKFQNICETVLKKWRVIVQKSLWKRKYFEITCTKLQTLFCSWYVKLAAVQIWRELNKFPLSKDSLKCVLQAKKVIWENSSKKNPLLCKQTPPTKCVQLGSQMTEPISAGKVY